MAAAIFAAAPVTAQAASRVPCDRAMIGNLPTAVTAHGAPEVAVASAYAALQRLRHQRQEDPPARAHTWPREDREAASWVASPSSPLPFLPFLSFFAPLLLLSFPLPWLLLLRPNGVLLPLPPFVYCEP